MSPASALSNSEALSVRIRKRFGDHAHDFTLDATFVVSPGFTVLFGVSGSGKTTLLDCIAGLRTPDEGRIAELRAPDEGRRAVRDTVLFDSASGVNLPPNRRGVGYLVQTLALFPHMSVAQNVDYGLDRLPHVERERRRKQILDSFRIAHLADRRPHEISGGERQRVALARALVTLPRLLLLDEPLSALDAPTKGKIVDDLRSWNQRHAIPILYVTHNREEVFALGDNALVMNAGRIVAQGVPQEVLGRPQSESVAQLTGFENIFDCEVSALHPEQGTMTCRIAATATTLEVPMVRMEPGQPVRVGIRAGDILLASAAPQGLSARNVLPGTITSLQQRDVTVIANVNCGVDFLVHLTLGARQSLHLEVGTPVWLVAKTYSCQVLR